MAKSDGRRDRDHWHQHRHNPSNFSRTTQLSNCFYSSFREQIRKNPDNTSKIATSPKSTNQPPASDNLSIPDAKPNAIAPNTTPSIQDSNREPKIRERTDKVAIAPEPSNSPTGNIGNLNSDRSRAAANLPSVADGITAGSSQSPRRFESPPSKDASQSAKITAEASKPASSAPSAAASRSTNADNAITTNIKVLKIQSELPTEISTALVGYIQTQRLTTNTSGTIALDLEISGDRITNISINNEGSTLKDNSAIAELQNLILKWRSANPVTGKIHLVLQL